MAFASDKGRQGAAGVSTGYDIANSLRFNDDDEASLSWTPSSAGDLRKWTWSGWVKVSSFDTHRRIFCVGNGNVNQHHLWFTDGNKLSVYISDGANANLGHLKTTQVFRDPSAWYHIVFVWDSDNATADDRSKLYVNGDLITAYEARTNPSRYLDSHINSANWIHGLGVVPQDGNLFLDGYLAEVNFIDGYAKTPSDFGETDETYGHWKAKEYTHSDGYGTNGFYLPFDNAGTKHTITANGDTATSTAQKKFGTASVSFDGSGDYLSIPDSDDWTFSGDFTIEMWFRSNNISSPASQTIISESEANGSELALVHYSDGEISFRCTGTSTIVTSGAGVSSNTWYHLAIVRSGSTIKVYLDGSSIISTTNSSTINPGNGIRFGSWYSGTDYYNGYMDEIRISNKARYTTGFSGSLPTTAFTDDNNTLLLIHGDGSIEDGSGVTGELGNDQSGEANHWTTNNLSITDQMLDSPTNNFATWNAIHPKSKTLTEGNLRVSTPSYGNVTATQLLTSGKWYWEGLGAGYSIGVCGEDGVNHSTSISATGSKSIGYWSGGSIYWDGGSGSGPASYTTTQIVAAALDMDAGTIKFYKENSLQGTYTFGSGTVPDLSAGVIPVWNNGSSSGATLTTTNFGQDSSFAGNKDAQGNQDSNDIGDFYYEPPSGYKALCTKNLADPAVVPKDNFEAKKYTGNNSSGGQDIALEFQPDLSWLKITNNSYSHVLFDSVRGASSGYLMSDATLQESTSHGGLEFQESGIKVKDGSVSRLSSNSSAPYVAWNWKAGGDDVLNEVGTIDSQVSANVDAGFSIVSFTGDGSASSTVGHGLSQTPELLIVKDRDGSDDWQVKYIEDNYYLILNKDWAASSSYPNYTATSSVINLGYTWNNDSDNDHIAYCFHSVDGYSKVGSYSGISTSGTDGPFVYLGFKPAYLLIKRYSSGTSDWVVFDNARDDANETDDILYPHLSAAEASDATGYGVDFVANGFKVKSSWSAINYTGYDFIYLAFAEHPFKYSTAR